jgi:hypothetical protein
MRALLANKRSEIQPFWTQARAAPGRLGHVTPTKAVILAHPQDVLRPAGSSPRFARDSLAPAPLLSVANRPLVAHALSWLQQAGVREAAVIASRGLHLAGCVDQYAPRPRSTAAKVRSISFVSPQIDQLVTYR